MSNTNKCNLDPFHNCLIINCNNSLLILLNLPRQNIYNMIQLSRSIIGSIFNQYNNNYSLLALLFTSITSFFVMRGICMFVIEMEKFEKVFFLIITAFYTKLHFCITCVILSPTLNGIHFRLIGFFYYIYFIYYFNSSKSDVFLSAPQEFFIDFHVDIKFDKVDFLR